MARMATIKFTASVVKTGKGRYVAHADEFPVEALPATTQRGAIRKLKDAVFEYLRRAANEGKLAPVLADAGFGDSLIYFPKVTLRCHYILDTPSVFLRLPYQGRRRRPTMDAMSAG
jgi:hypothetical protein